MGYLGKQKSNWWFLLPLFFGIIGGVIAYFVLRNNDPKKAKNCLYVGIIMVVVGIMIIGLAVFYSYSADQVKLRGYSFGNNLQMIQDDLKKTQDDFGAKFKMLNENHITKDEFLEYSQKHFEQMQEIILRYDQISVPDAFVTSVKLFKLSTETQLDSDKEFVEWVRTGDEAARIRSDNLLQESFEYEVAALSSYNSAKAQINP